MSYYPYSSKYYPAIPTLELYLGRPGEEPELGPSEAIVDTGADGTLIPIAYLRQIKARLVDQGIVRSHWGEQRAVPVYSVAMKMKEHRFAAIWVVGDDQGDEIILGRNVLNRLRLLLDGPAAMTEVLER